MKRIQSKSHQLWTFKFNSDKLYIHDKGVQISLYRYKYIN